MEEVESVKEWFVTHNGKQYGPVLMEDLKYEADRGELNPHLDMVWKNGMKDWIPAGEVAGLFNYKEETKAEEEATCNEVEPEIRQEASEGEEKFITEEWAGMGRGTYFIVCFILPFLWIAGVWFATIFLQGKVDSKLLEIGGLSLALVPFIMLIFATFQRFQNLGMSRAWFFGLFVPLLNLWVCYRLIACPPGYGKNKKLDLLGWVLAIFHWGSLLVVLAACGFAAYTLIQAAEDDPMRIAIEKYIEKAQQIQERVTR